MSASRAFSRRAFIRGTAALGLALGAASLIPASRLSAASARGRLGVFVALDGKEPEEALAPAHQLGLGYCELYLNSFSEAYGARLRSALEKFSIQATALFASGPGAQVYDFYQGPETLGLVPRQFREARVAALKQASDFARQCGIPAFETHCGFLPENPNDPLYKEAIAAIREVAAHCRRNGQTFLYHAGQETPVTLLRTMQDVGLDNQGVGLDTANLIMCGKGHPIDALDVYGRHLKAVNAKDGLYPTDAKQLGKETPLGQGKVDFPRFLRRLKELGYQSPIIIEREISGPELIPELTTARNYLEAALRQLE
jgi:L-ribulose-5-phosphate 3-epimerase